MKKIVLSALLLALAATSAHAAEMWPRTDRAYFCNYTNPTMNEVTPDGISRFVLSQIWLADGSYLLRGVENFLANHGVDQRKVTFAKPFNRYLPDPFTGQPVLVSTRWEFTVNPGGPQCTAATVFAGGNSISFQNCSDGHSRTCKIVY
jgi:hypothetical protein